MDWVWAAGVAGLAVPSLYLYTVGVVSTRFPKLQNKRICLLIAHPDDEAMFFAPTVLALTQPETGNHVKILCLSSGDADGLGETRKRELAKSGLILGLRKEDDVFVVDNPEFPDSMSTTWDTNKVSELLCSAFAPYLAASKNAGPGSKPPTPSIDVIVTFDANGVSHHPNHKSLYHGAKSFVAALVEGKPGWASPVDLYTLSTISLVRKYMGIFDVVFTLVKWAVGTAKKDKQRPEGLVFLNGVGVHGIATAWRAMITAHKSQMRWFRYGWITLSRYMYINDLKLEKVQTRR